MRALTAAVDEFSMPAGKRPIDLRQRPKTSTKKSTKAAPTPKRAAARRTHAKRLEKAQEAEKVAETTFEFSTTKGPGPVKISKPTYDLISSSPNPNSGDLSRTEIFLETDCHFLSFCKSDKDISGPRPCIRINRAEDTG